MFTWGGERKGGREGGREESESEDDMENFGTTVFRAKYFDQNFYIVIKVIISN